MRKVTTLDKLCTFKIVNKIQNYSKERTEENKYPLKGGGKGFKGYTNFTNCKKNTITITNRGTCGFVDFINEDFAITKGCVALENISEEVDVYYLYCFLKAREPYIKSLSRGCCIKHLRKSELEKIVISYPNLEEQRRIVSILKDFSRYINIAEEELQRLEKLYPQLRKTILKSLIRKTNNYELIHSLQRKEL